MPEKLWGSIGYNAKRQSWFVRGRWQGERLYYSTYQTILGHKSCKTEQEAQQLQFLISAEMERGNFNPLRYKKAKPHHIKKYSETWLESVRGEIAYSSWYTYRASMQHIVAGLGDIYIQDLSYKIIKTWLSGMDVHLQTKKNTQGVLIRMMKDALRNGDITQLPEFVRFEKGWAVPVKHKTWIDEQTQRAILEHIPKQDRFIFQFLFSTGVRVSEARALRKREIYRDRGYIAIRSTFSHVRGGEALVGVKQKRDREIPFYASLNEWWDDIPMFLNSEFVFNHSRTGKPYTRKINRGLWNPACEKVLGYVVPLNNCGRHSFANQLARDGVPMDVISKLLGHSNVKITESHYADPNLNVMGKMVDEIRIGQHKGNNKK